MASVKTHKARTLGTQTSGQGRGVHRESKEKGVQVGKYPSLAEKASVTMEKCKKDMFPNISKAGKEVYMFIRGKKEYVRRLKNAFIRDKRVVENYGGRYLGLAEELKRYEGDLYRGMPEQCIILIEFKDMAHAERWSYSSGIFKQKDFPTPADEVEMFAAPVSYLPNEDLTAFQLTEMYKLKCPEEFQHKYVDHVPKLLNARHIYHGVVATHEVNRLRNCMIRPNTFILLNGADSEEKLKTFYDSPEYQPFKEYRQQTVVDTNTCFFTMKSVYD